jgi:hypothetical protein
MESAMRARLMAAVAVMLAPLGGAPAEARIVCRDYVFMKANNNIGDCQSICRTVMNTPAAERSARAVAWVQGARIVKGGGEAAAGPEAVPFSISSCKAKDTWSAGAACLVTYCGIEFTAQDVRKPLTRITVPEVKTPVPKPRVGPPVLSAPAHPTDPIKPGLLESGQGLTLQQGPAATGTPLVAPSSSSPPPPPPPPGIRLN